MGRTPSGQDPSLEESPSYRQVRTGQEARPLQQGAYLSHALGREQPFSYLLPYDVTQGPPDSDRRYPLLILLHGHGGKHTDWATYTRIARYLAAYELIVVFPEGDNGWYTNAANGAALYEDDLIQDCIGYLQANLPVIPAGQGWGIGGLSMGGYGAIKLALKYPHLFSLALSHSGALEKMQTHEVHPVFGDPQQDRAMRKAENPFWLAEQVLSRMPPLRPHLYFDCGLHDALLEASRRFDGHLHYLGYHHTYRELPGHHTWPYWDRAFRTILPTLAAELGAMPFHSIHPVKEE